MRVYDDERRAVAENLRNEALHGRVGYLEQFRDRLADTLLIDRATYADMFDRLADLVEPSCDRGALLALADEMEGGFLLFGSTKSARQVFDFLSDKLGEYARRIREACGEAGR